MQKYLIAAVLVVSFTAPVLAVETFYIIFDNTMKGLHDRDDRTYRQGAIQNLG